MQTAKALDAIAVRRPLTTVTLALVAMIAALIMWAGLAWASGGSVPSPTDVPRVVFMQSTDPGGAGGHHCHNGGGGSGDTTPAPASASGGSASL